MKHKYLCIAFILSLMTSSPARAAEDFQDFTEQDLSKFLENKEPECKTRLFKIFEEKIKDFIHKNKINEDPRKQLALTMSVFAILYEFSDKIDKVIGRVVKLEYRFSENEHYYPEILDHDAIFMEIFAGELWDSMSWNQFLVYVNEHAPWVHEDEENTVFDLVFADIRGSIRNHYLSPNGGEEDSSFEDLFYQAHDLTFHPHQGLRDPSVYSSLSENELIPALVAKMIRVSEYMVLDYMVHSRLTESLLEEVYETTLSLLPSKLPLFVNPSWLIDFHSSLLDGQGSFTEFQVYHSWIQNFYVSLVPPFVRQRQISGASYGQFLAHSQRIKKVEETKSKEIEEDKSKGKEEEKEEETQNYKRKLPSVGGESSESASSRKRLRTDEPIDDKERLTDKEKEIIENLIADSIGRDGQPNLEYAEKHLSTFAFLFLLSHFCKGQ